MRLEKCPNGHFYDADKYSSCPHCGGGAGPVDETRPVNTSLDETQPLSAVRAARAGAAAAAPALPDDDKTLSFYHKGENNAQQEPVVGWLVCTKGTARGKSFCLKAGRNYIGRDKTMDIALTGENTVSRTRHAILVFEPKSGTFLAQAGESSELFYLNGEVVLTPMEMKKNDTLSIGEVELMLIPCCDDKFSWNT